MQGSKPQENGQPFQSCAEQQDLGKQGLGKQGLGEQSIDQEILCA